MSVRQAFRITVVVIATILIAYAMLLSIRVLVVLLVAIIVASAVRPAMLWLTERRVPEPVALVLVYGALALALFLLAVAVIPPAVNGLAGYIESDNRLADRLISAQSYIESNIERTFNVDVRLLAPEDIRRGVADVVRDFRAAAPTMLGELGGLLGDFILVFVMGAYWLTSRDQGVTFTLQLFSIGQRAEVSEIIAEIEHSLGAYVRGITMVAAVVGILNFAILSLLGVPNAVTLAFIVGVTTALPILGGYIGAGLATFLALLSSPIHALMTFATFVLVQQLENHWLTPRTMAQSVGLNPLLIIVFLFVGFSLGGVIGALIAVPVAGTLMIVARHLVIEPRKEEAAPQRVDGGVLLVPKEATE